MALEITLKPDDFLKKLLGLGLDVLLDEIELDPVVSRELARINILNEYLALFQASPYLVRQPCGDRGSSCSSWVLNIVNNILFNHAPMLVSEFESSMDILQHQECRVCVFQGESLLACRELL